MLRTAAVARAALRRQVVASPRSSMVLARGPDLRIHHRSTPRLLLLLPVTVSSRGYARMARRSPPVRPEVREEESESESEDEEVDFDTDEDDGGEEESEEWEGFMLDFGSDGKEKDKGANQEDDGS